MDTLPKDMDYQPALDTPPRQPLPDPLVAAMGKMLVDALNREVGLEATNVDLRRRIAELEGK